MLIVRDGWGAAPDGPHNAIHLARTPVIDELTAAYPSTAIAAHGRAVGLPSGQMGNSEVGHLNLGAGRVVKQDLVLIDEAIEDGSFGKNPVLLDAAEKIKAAGGVAHLMGLCSPGGVHSSLEHLYALVDLLAAKGLRVKLHALTDGRDTPPRSAREYLETIEKRIAGKAEVAVVVGRFYTMDRDTRWERVERGYLAHVDGQGTPHRSADEAIAAAYDADENDEFITPRIIVDQNGTPKGTIRNNDGVFFFNFRADRAREITRALTESEFEGFTRTVRPTLSSYVCLTEYQQEFDLPIAFPPVSLTNILAEVLAQHKFTQLRCAETEKYAHVTFFFNGGVEEPYPEEDRVLIPSPKEVATYDLKPEMSAAQVGNAVIEKLAATDYDFVLVNFANCDMVGHTGFLKAAITAAEAVDREVGRLTEAVLAKGGAVVITADHGNAEKMMDTTTGQPHTAHTNNAVQLVLVDDRQKGAKLRSGGALGDVAPTLLELLGLGQPAEMTGTSLLVAK